MGPTTNHDTSAELTISRCAVFGVPTATSEVSRLPGYYRPECLIVFSAAICNGGQVEEAAAAELALAA